MKVRNFKKNRSETKYLSIRYIFVEIICQDSAKLNEISERIGEIARFEKNTFRGTINLRQRCYIVSNQNHKRHMFPTGKFKDLYGEINRNFIQMTDTKRNKREKNGRRMRYIRQLDLKR